MKVLDVLKYFLKNEYLTSTCTWYIFGVLGVLEYLVNCTSPQPCCPIICDNWSSSCLLCPLEKSVNGWSLRCYRGRVVNILLCVPQKIKFNHVNVIQFLRSYLSNPKKTTKDLCSSVQAIAPGVPQGSVRLGLSIAFIKSHIIHTNHNL